jgi:hypothetical protein
MRQFMPKWFSSPTMRYLRARFRPLNQPRIWAPALGLVGLGVFAYEVSQRRDWQQAFKPNDRPTLNQPTSEDLAIGADIDSLPLLLAPVKPQETPKPGTGLPKADRTTFPLSDLFGKASLDGPKPLTNGPSLLAAPPTNNPILPANPQSLATALATPARRYPAANSSQPNALAAAVARYAQPQARPEISQIAPTNNSLPPTSSPQSAPTPLQGNVPISTSNYDPSLQTPPTLGNGPAPLGNPYPINAYSVLSQPNADLGSANSGLGPNTLPSNASGNTGPYAPAPTTINVPPPELPFTAPRSIPGQSIGGGEIGTFSNP